MTIKDGDTLSWTMPSGGTLTLMADRRVPPGVFGVILPPRPLWRPTPFVCGVGFIYPVKGA